MPKLARGAVALPGRLIVVDYGLLRASDDPAVAAGFILASQAAMIQSDPLEGILKEAGLGTTFRLLTTGEVPAETLQDAAQALVASASAETDPSQLRDLFAATQIPLAPYVAVEDARTGTMPDLGDDLPDAADFRPVLNDSDWVSLQNICDI